MEKDKFCFTGIDIERMEDSVKMSMKDYAGIITEIEEIRTGEKMEALTKIENKLYRKYVGKISWLAENCRPDLSIVALKLARRSKEPKLEDLHYINKVVRKIKMKKNEVNFTKIGRKEDLEVSGIGDASYKMGEKSIGGNVVLLRNKRNKKVLPLFWKSKSIQNVCHSSKEAETRNMVKLLDETLYQANIIEQIMYN